MYYDYSDNINPQPSNYETSSAPFRPNNSGNGRSRCCWIRAIHARRPAAAHRPVPPARPDPWGLRDQWAPEGALAHLAQQAQPAPWGHRVT